MEPAASTAAGAGMDEIALTVLSSTNGVHHQRPNGVGATVAATHGQTNGVSFAAETFEPTTGMRERASSAPALPHDEGFWSARRWIDEHASMQTAQIHKYDSSDSEDDPRDEDPEVIAAINALERDDASEVGTFLSRNTAHSAAVYTEAAISQKYKKTVARKVKREDLRFENLPLKALAQNVFFNLLPIITWARKYSSASLRGDLVSGLTVSVILVPQALSYALLAGLPPVYGLYTSLTPILVYAVTGGCPHLAVGPFALVSLLVSDLIMNAVPDDYQTGEQYIQAVLQLSMLTGLVQILMGALRLGVVVSFMADSVVSAFTTAAALLIMSTQMKYLLGITIPRGSFFQTAYNICRALPDANLWTVVVAFSAVAFMHAVRYAAARWAPGHNVPEQLLCVVLFGLVSWAAALSEGPYRVDTVGTIPAGLPTPKSPFVPWGDRGVILALLQPSVVTAVVSYMVSMSIVRKFGAKYDYEVDPNQELVSLGLGNVAGSFFRAYPSCGSLSRSAVVAAVGGPSATPAHNVVQVGAVALTLLVLTPLFQPLPYAVLAGIIVMALKNMVDFDTCKRLYKVSRGDAYLWMFTFAATISFGVQVGLVAGVVASLLWLVWQTSRPWFAFLGRLPHSHIYRNVQRYAEAVEVSGVLIFRFDSMVHFANKAYFKDILLAKERTYEGIHGRGSLRHVIIEASGITGLDASGLMMLQALLEEHEKREPPVDIILTGCKGPTRRALQKFGLKDKFGPERLFENLHAAVRHLGVGPSQRKSEEEARTYGQSEEPLEVQVTPDGGVDAAHV